MDFNERCRCVCTSTKSIDILPEAKEERGRKTEREREVTLLAEWQWPSCIASLKWGWGGECHFQVSPRHSPLMRDGFCSADSQGDQGNALPPLLPIPPPLRSLILQGADSSKIRKPASPPPAQPHFPIITTTTKVGRFLFTGILPVFVTHISSFTSLLIQMIPTYILTLAQTTAPTSLFLSEGRTLMLFS